MSLGEEIKVVQNVLDKQLKMLSDSAISLELGDAQRNTHSHINATLERCKTWVTVRKQEFLELQQRASMLREQVSWFLSSPIFPYFHSVTELTRW